MIQRVKTIKLQLPHPLMVWALLWTELNEKNREKIVLAVIIQYTDPTIMTVGNTNAAIVFLYFAIRDPYAGDVISVSPIWEYIIPPAKENKKDDKPSEPQLPPAPAWLSWQPPNIALGGPPPLPSNGKTVGPR